MKYHFTLTRISIIKKTVTAINKDVEKVEPSYVAGGNVKWCSHFGKVWQFLKEFNVVTI